MRGGGGGGRVGREKKKLWHQHFFFFSSSFFFFFFWFLAARALLRGGLNMTNPVDQLMLKGKLVGLFMTSRCFFFFFFSFSRNVPAKTFSYDPREPSPRGSNDIIRYFTLDSIKTASHEGSDAAWRDR